MHFADPQANVLQFGLREGMKVADLGSGVGHYALAASPIIGDTGRIYAVDVQEDVLVHLANSAQQRRMRNIVTVWGNIEKSGGTALKAASIDAVILSNTLFQLENAEEAIKEIKRVLVSGGKVLVVDWAGSYDGMGPAPEAVVPEHTAEELFVSHGFHKVKAFRGGPHHYSLVFAAP
jgi:ubiquinone/menaquinone biosynthesis C-methylase UbiE